MPQMSGSKSCCFYGLEEWSATYEQITRPDPCRSGFRVNRDLIRKCENWGDFGLLATCQTEKPLLISAPLQFSIQIVFDDMLCKAMKSLTLRGTERIQPDSCGTGHRFLWPVRLRSSRLQTAKSSPGR